MPNIVVAESCVVTEAAVVDPGTGDLAVCAWDRGLDSDVIGGLDRVFFDAWVSGIAGAVAALIQGDENIGGGDAGGFNWSINDPASFGDVLIIGWYGLEVFTVTDTAGLIPLAPEFSVLVDVVSVTAALPVVDIGHAVDSQAIFAALSSADTFATSEVATPSPLWQVTDAVTMADAVSARGAILPDIITSVDAADFPPADLSSADAFSSLAFATPGAALSGADALATSEVTVALPSLALPDGISSLDAVSARSFTLADFCLAIDIASVLAILSAPDTFGEASQTSSAFNVSAADAYFLTDQATQTASLAPADMVVWTEVISADRQAIDLFVAVDLVPLVAVAVTDVGSASIIVVVPAPTVDTVSLSEAGIIGLSYFDALSATGAASVPSATVGGSDTLIASMGGMVDAILAPVLDNASVSASASVHPEIVAQDFVSADADGLPGAFLFSYDDIMSSDVGVFPDLHMAITDGMFVTDRCKGFPAGALPGPKPYVRPRRAPLPVTS